MKKLGEVQFIERDFFLKGFGKGFKLETINGIPVGIDSHCVKPLNLTEPLLEIRSEPKIIQEQSQKKVVIFQVEYSLSMSSRDESFYYLYNGKLYRDKRKYTEDQSLLLIMEIEDKDREKFEKLKKKFELVEEAGKEPKRERIPEEVRIAVWRRDGGKCAECGSRENLEYDHIIPVSKGGSNTVRNIQLLCESCNRKKKDRI